MEIKGEFKYGTITISNLKTEDGDYKCHFEFDVNISMYNIDSTYHFGEAMYLSMYDFIDNKQDYLVDENEMDNRLEMTKEYFAIKTDKEGSSSYIKINFDMWDDQEKLVDFLIELKAECEVLMQ